MSAQQTSKRNSRRSYTMLQGYRGIKKGERVYDYSGATYGCIDWNVETPVTRDPEGNHPFVGVPFHLLDGFEGGL